MNIPPQRVVRPAATLAVLAVILLATSACAIPSVSLSVFGLSTTPDDVVATVRLEGAGGESVTGTPTTPEWACDQPGDLTLYTALTDAEARAIGDDGSTYQVALVLDGETYTASGDTAQQMSSDLVFTPVLP
jgi:hypothetical protein